MGVGRAWAVLVLLWAGAVLAGGLEELQSGNEAFRRGAFEEAVDAYTRALAAGDLDLEALAVTYNNRGVAYNELGDFDRAIADYREALDLKPGDRTTLRNLRIAYVRRAVAAANLGRYEEALADLDTAVELAPDHPLAYLRRAEVYMELGDFDAARRDIARAERLRPPAEEMDRVRRRLVRLEELARRALLSAAQEEASEGFLDDQEPIPVSEAQPTDRRPPPAAGPGEGTGSQQQMRARVDVNAREGPGNAFPVLRVARKGELLTVVGEERGWKRVRFADGTEAYIYRRWLEPADAGGD